MYLLPVSYAKENKSHSSKNEKTKAHSFDFILSKKTTEKTDTRESLQKPVSVYENFSNNKANDSIKSGSIKSDMKDQEVNQTPSRNNNLKDVEKDVEKVLNKVAEAMGISKEELSKIMSQLQLVFIDLYSNEKLKTLFNEVFAIENDVELLTNKDAFHAFKELKQVVNTILKEEKNDTEDPNLLKQVINNEKLIKTEDLQENKQHTLSEESKEESTKVQENKGNIEIVDSRNKEIHKEISLDKEIRPVEIKNEGFDNSKSKDQSQDRNGNGLNNTKSNNIENHFENMLSHTVVNKFHVVSANGIDQTIYETTTIKEVISQITTNVRIALTNETTTMTFKLQPENLGKIAFSVKSENGLLTGNFLAESSQVKEALEMNISNLKASLEQQGIKLEEIKIVVGNTDQFFGQNEHEKNSNHSFHERRKKFQPNGNQNFDQRIDETKEALRSTGLEEDNNLVDFTA